MNVRTFDRAPSSHMPMSQVRAMLGLQNTEVTERLLANGFVRRALDNRLASRFAPLPDDRDDPLAGLFSDIAMASFDGLMLLSRRITVLINRRAILWTADGAVLREIVAWCQAPGVIDWIRAETPPPFTDFTPLSGVSPEILDLFAQKVLLHLTGVLPDAYRQRLYCRFEPDELPAPVRFAADDPDRQSFLACALKAHAFGSRERSADAAN